MPSSQTLYLFGDQTFDIQPHLKTLLRHRDNPVLEDFLVKAYGTIRSQIGMLSAEMQENIPRFTSLDDLILWKQRERRCIPLDMAVMVMYQLGVFISEAGSEYPRLGNARILGLCTGSLAATAVSCAQNTLDLVPLAVEVVAVAFRTGLLVADLGRRVSVDDVRLDKSWSIIIGGPTAAQALSLFCEQSKAPSINQPYISAVAPSGITISGPPSTLKQLLASEPFRGLRHKTIPVFGPYHAPHLFSEDDAADIIAGIDAGSTDTLQKIPVLSGSGVEAAIGTFRSALQAAVGQILLAPVCWKDVLGAVQTWLEQSSPNSFQIRSIATTAEQLIYSALKQTSLQSLLPASTLPSKPTVAQEGSTNTSPKQAKLAIIGLSGRYPGAKDNEAFWDLLYQGLDVVKEVPALHWDAKTHVDPTGKAKNTSATPWGCWLDEPAAFDARFFNISPREAAQIDPAQRIALMTAYEAIEQAGIVPDATPSTRRDRVGVFYGVTSNDWMETNSAQNIDTYFIPGGNRAFIPGRINYCFKFSGPSYSVDTACSSSLAAIHLACNALWRGEIDTAIAGGTNILTNPDFTSGLDRGHFLSRTGNCKTFDDGADGYCRGEGVGTIIVKRLEDAIADKDPIEAVILGAATNHSAESESITRPHVGAQRAIFDKILNSAGVEPYDVGYIEMHGTGTQAGDAGEMSSVLSAFAPPLRDVQKGRTDDQALYLGSAKSNIGHGEAVSGVCALIKALMMMKKSTIVPHCGIKTKINSKFPTDLDERNVRIARRPTPWQRQGAKPRRVFVNNFSAAGGNTALLIEDPPLLEPLSPKEDPRIVHLVAISAKNGKSLQGNLRSMLTFLQQNPTESLGALSYTTTARRIHHPHRVMLHGTRPEELCQQIEMAIQSQTGMTRSKSAPRLLFTFTGNGAQYPGMGKQLWENFALFRAEMQRLDRIGQSLGFPSALPVIASDERDISRFTPTAVQLATSFLQIALTRLWASWNIHPQAVVGHSLGEFAALNVAGVLSDSDTVYLVGKRAQLLEEKCTRDTHAMLVVKGSVKDIFVVLKDEQFETACTNSAIETVLAGPTEDIARLKGMLTEAGLTSTHLAVPYAFHSSQVDPILDNFTALAQGVTFLEGKIPIICPLDSSVRTGGFNAEYLARHCREPVAMRSALESAYACGIISDQTITLEIGPHPAVSGMIKANFPNITNLPVLQRGKPAFQSLTQALKTLYVAGADIRWSKYHADFESSHKVISLPAYAWDLKDYWMQYVNDWSLRKGDAPLVIQGASKLESTTIHNIVEEIGDAEKVHIVVEADIARKDLAPLVQGHEVDGIPLCTPSVYCDMALTLGTYLVDKYYPTQENRLVDVTDMTISKALILNPAGNKQLLQAHADVNWAKNEALVKFMSFNAKQQLQEHSRCTLRWETRNLLKKLEKDAAGVKQKMQILREGIATEESARFNRAMVYRMIRPLAQFHDDYRAIDEVVLNSNTLEACSKVSFGTVKKDGDYHTHPAVIDALTQSCGFTMNCNDASDLDREVFMNHGWGRFQMFEAIDLNKQYTTYSQMHEGADKLWYGDVVVFDGDRVVAMFKEIAIQGVPRRVLKVILNLESGQQKRSVQDAPPSAKKQPAAASPAVATRPRKATAPEPNRVVAPKIARAMAIIAEESGIAESELTDNTVFADVGVDSLMGLTISARFDEELGLDVDSSSMFLEYPAVKDLKAFLGQAEGPSADGTATPSSGLFTPDDSANDSGSSSEYTDITLPDQPSLEKEIGVFKRVLEIISEESGISPEELTDDTQFADSGIDSLLSLVVVSRLRDELELDIQHESLFLECPTVRELRQLLIGDTLARTQSARSSEAVPANASSTTKPRPSQEQLASLARRKEGIDTLVAKYTADFCGPESNPAASFPGESEKVVLVTGATGSLGCHITYHLAQLEHVKTIVCLNRENRAPPFERQIKAMREKGIRWPEALIPKLQVLQTDTAKPRFGLDQTTYDGLVGSVTHLIHNAWPMSAKRALPGFESQFQVQRNLIDFATEVASNRPEDFVFSFQMVSSIGVVGHYNLGTSDAKTVVPEQRATIDSVLTNGYSEAKWGCERMLDETLHHFPQRFRTMAVRLGQIAGSKTSGYWNPMEHFGFLVKSSQTLGVLPDLEGGLFWTPVNDIAGALSDLVLANNTPYPIYHIENPIGQDWKEMTQVLASALQVKKIIPFYDWLERVRNAPTKDNPASSLLDFLDDNFLRMSCGGLVLDTKHTVEHSPILASTGPVSDIVAKKYIQIWKEIGFLKTSDKERARFHEIRAELWPESTKTLI